MPEDINVTVGMVRHVLHDIEDWVNDVRMVLAVLDSDSTVATVSGTIKVPAVPEVDGAPVAEDAPAIAHKLLRSHGLLDERIRIEKEGGVYPPPPPCTSPLAKCEPDLERGKPIFPRDLVVGLRGIEILIAFCRDLISRMPDQPIRNGIS